MTSSGTRILGLNEMRTLLPLDESIELQRAAFIAIAEDRTTSAPNGWLHLRGERRAWLKILAGHDESARALGVKILARFPERGPGVSLASLLLLFDDEDGSPLAIMDAVYVTAVRTAAAAALATRALAPEGARRVGLLGTGTLGWYSVLAHQIECPELDQLAVYSRSAERREAFAKRVRDETGIAAHAVATPAEAAAGADVIVTATNSPTPVLMSEHLRPGQHIAAIGIRSEIAPDAIGRCRVIADGHDEALHDGKFSTAVAAGLLDESDLGPDLGAVLAGLAHGRTADDEITLFDSSGVAIQDVVCARFAWERAEESDAGTVVTFTDGGVLD